LFALLVSRRVPSTAGPKEEKEVVAVHSVGRVLVEALFQSAGAVSAGVAAAAVLG
jgi:hypothetical protein